MSTETSKSEEALIIHEYLNSKENTIKLIAERLNIPPNRVDRVVNNLIKQKKQNIGRF
jgi:DNA-binding IscR family transcriptional regulator